jgi:uncharacterized repeat protein (TIGR03803 family)
MANAKQHQIWTRGTSLRAAAVGLVVAIIFGLTVVAAQTAQAQTFNVIHSFTGGRDGANPYAGLTMDAAGNLYGTAMNGGVGHSGAIFKLSHGGSGWVLTPLYNFAGGDDGAGPGSRVIFGPDGGLYGTTVGGGGYCDFDGLACGTVFSLKPPVRPPASVLASWTETVLHRFAKIGGDGNGPIYGDVTFDEAGNLYGTTALGGRYGNCEYDGCGTAYKLTPSGDDWSENLIWEFGHGPEGVIPFNGMTFDNAGNLYGTTNAGGEAGMGGGSGTAFQLKPSGSGWQMIILHSFQDRGDGRYPHAGMIFDGAGNLYGASSDGGPNGGGVIFELMPLGSGWTFNEFYNLTGTPGYRTGPGANLFMDNAGNLYGTTQGSVGAPDWGTVFKLTLSDGAWAYTLLHRFTGGSDGAYPICSLVSDPNGDLYGTTSQGGTNGYGVVFKITP